MMAASSGGAICLRCRREKEINSKALGWICGADLECSKSAAALKKGMLGGSGKRVCQGAPACPFWGHPEDGLNLQILLPTTPTTMTLEIIPTSASPAPSYSPPKFIAINQRKVSSPLASTREKWLSQKKNRRKAPLPGRA